MQHLSTYRAIFLFDDFALPPEVAEKGHISLEGVCNGGKIVTSEGAAGRGTASARLRQ